VPDFSCTTDLNADNSAPPPFAITIEGINLHLLTKRGVFWPEQKSLFVADTHFGKEATFRSHGIAAPRGSSQGTLAKIGEMISACDATHLFLLGDMFHARSSFSLDIRESLDNFFESHSQLRTTMVLGNHDRGLRDLIRSWPIEIVASGTSIDCISISHIPQAASPSTRLLLCGHLHPAYRVSSRADSVGKLPCFWLFDRQLVLPAIGEFTGTKVIRPGKSDQTWVIADDQILRV
jgi:DNA ligase-associated metallophosphoesterase